MLLCVLTLEQMAEYQLILINGFLGDDKSQRPAHFIVERECFVDIQSTSRRRSDFVQILILLLCGIRIATKGLGTKGSAHDPCNKKLVAQCIPVQDRSDIVFKNI